MTQFAGVSRRGPLFIYNSKTFWLLYIKRYCFTPKCVKFRVFGPQKDNDTVPWYAECTWWLSKGLFVCKLYGPVLWVNISFEICGAKLLNTLNILVSNTYRFLCWIETKLLFFAAVARKLRFYLHMLLFKLSHSKFCYEPFK